MKKIRIGIIGAGQIGLQHMESYSHMPDAELVAVCNRTAEKAVSAAEKYGISRVYTDYRELLQCSEIDAVDVCLHNALHAPVAIAALRAGKHVYCEKPMADSYQNALAMQAAAEETGCMLHIQLSTLYMPYAKAARRLVDGGALGEIYHARSAGLRRRGRPFVDGYGPPQFVQRESAGGGALLDCGVYRLALVLSLLGRPVPDRISGAVYQKTGMDDERRKASGYNVEELATGYVRFTDGKTLELFEGWAAHLNTVEPSALLGSRGGVKFGPDVFSYHTTFCDLELNCTGNLDEMELRWKRTLPNENAYSDSQAHWIAALQGKVPLFPTAKLALDTMLISEGIYLSSALGREVTADEVRFSAGRKTS